MSVNAANVVTPEVTVLVMVIVSVLLFVVICMPVPLAKVKVSVLESATTLLCPATAILLKRSDAEPPLAVELIVMLSVAASVVMVMFEPAIKVKVSVLESATTLDWPATAIVAKLSEAEPPETVAHELSPLK